MALIQFVQNYQDLSTDKGYQFKFHCDKCGNGFMTRFQASTFGLAESALAIAGSLFGGAFNTARNAEYEIQRAVGGKAHDSALESAVVEGKEHFHQCGRCGRWVCPEVCWNAESNLCDGCAPKLAQEMAATMTERDALVAIAFRHYAKEVVAISDVAVASGTPIIAVTDSQLSPLAKDARILFTIPEDEYTFSRSLAAPMCLVQCIAVATAALLQPGHESAPRIPTVTGMVRERMTPDTRRAKAPR